MTPRLTTIFLLASLVLCGCVERVDAPLPVDKRLATLAGHWQEAHSFGGPAEVSTESDDPWQRRFKPGTFARISGLDATKDEVWVCDTAISRLQIFDYDGNLLRTIGMGVPVPGAAPSDRELYAITQSSKVGSNDFELSPAGQRWIGHERELFLASDVLVMPYGYMIADLAKTSIYDQGKRTTGIVTIPFDPSAAVSRIAGLKPGWPSYLAGSADGKHFAVSDPLRNTVYLIAPRRKEGSTFKSIGSQAQAQDVMSAMFASATSPMPFPMILAQAGGASGEVGRFNNAGGVAVAYDKVLACDTDNKRIQIFEARADDDFFWGRILHIIDASKPNGQPRFAAPRDIDVAPDGRVYVLDADRQEVVELSPDFDRLGVVAKGFGDAFALDISPDGKHIFVTDRSDEKVHHYVRSD